MALVPSGRIRVMEAQSFIPYRLAQANGDALSAQPQPETVSPHVRPNIEQEQVGGQQPAPEAEQTPMTQPDAGSLVGNEETEKQEKLHQEIGEGDDLQAAFEQILESIGVEKRQILEHRANLFKEKVDLSNNTVKGYYLLPTYTIKGPLSKRKALQIAQQLGRKFNLKQELEPEPVKGTKGVINWKIDFSTAPQVDMQQGGSSFDGLNGSSSGGGGTARAASTLGEMIKARKQETFETLRRIAQGE
jgi:hypothetical protein